MCSCLLLTSSVCGGPLFPPPLPPPDCPSSSCQTHFYQFVCVCVFQMYKQSVLVRGYIYSMSICEFAVCMCVYLCMYAACVCIHHVCVCVYTSCLCLCVCVCACEPVRSLVSSVLGSLFLPSFPHSVVLVLKVSLSRHSAQTESSLTNSSF